MGRGANSSWDVQLEGITRREALSGFTEGEELMAAWTNKELQEMRRMHEDGCPAVAVLVAAFPRHSAASVTTTCCSIGIRRAQHHTKWICLAHEYFAEKERLWMAYRY